MDFITGLPPSKDTEGNVYDAIQVVVDHDVSKAIVVSPCTTKITSEGTADLLFRDVYKHFGYPDRVISDRGPQFIASSFK